ncbi:hypothetical protein J7E70_16010 [Variovorax paradoxus]|nr:3-hydroxyacyl-CoA dehydrogenase [Variovorax paradoxus]MBT2301968.1 hypothetical protein [Variovorax paradoxus]
MDEIAVVGPGLMGLGIAQVCAAAGLRVRLVGRDAASAHAGAARLAAQVGRQVEKGRLDRAAAEALLSRVTAVDEMDALRGCAMAIESAPEDRALKRDVLQRIELALAPGALIATNTSGLPVSGLATALRRPERFLGLHFFSPVDRMDLVEVVRGRLTARATLQEALALVERLGKSPVVVSDAPGFFTSRVFAAYLDEAIAMVGEGVEPQRIEQAGVALGRAIAPLALLDDISLSLNLQQIRQAQADGLPPERCRPLAEPVLAALVARGRGGRREGGGFYEPAADGARALWPGLATLFPGAGQQPDADRVAERLRIAEVAEALRCLEEGVVDSADEADAASVLGLGFPRREGGVLRWAETLGLARLVARCELLAREHGARFAPSDWLRRHAEQGGDLRDYRQPTTHSTAPA